MEILSVEHSDHHSLMSHRFLKQIANDQKATGGDE